MGFNRRIMESTKFPKEEEYLNHLILHSHDIPSAIGLLNGGTGIALVLMHYSRVRKCRYIEKSVDFLIENILKRISKTTKTEFASGLSGIGWGIEYLIQNKYMKGCGADLLLDIDKQIMNIDFSRCENYNLFDGLKGYLHYAIAHLQGANIAKKKVFDFAFVQSLVFATEKAIKANTKDSELETLYANLLECIAGKTEVYIMELERFINKNAINNRKDLTLYSGIAGWIELKLNK